MALENMGIKRPKLVSFGKKEKREEGEGEEKKKGRRWRRSSQASQGMELWIFGMETTLSMDFVWIIWNCKALYD